MNFKELADLIIPNYLTIEDLEKKYPERNNLEKGQMVTRFAPSPTGFLHTGSLFTAYINYKFAHDTNGIFYLRIEDTDQAREVTGSVDTLIEQLNDFGIQYNNDEVYGPYIQTKRKEIYDSVIHYLISIGRAYPCFCSKDELNSLKETQEKANIKTGYYGKYAKCRFLTNEEAANLINKGMPYVIRFKSLSTKFDYYDELRGKLNLQPNDMDIVIRKMDGLPTYHFAHCCDDHFMRTSMVIRGEEWLASLPIHYELFTACGFEIPKYLHLPTIMKLDDGKRRKLSKRKDKEASVTYLLEQGYPKNAIIEYLLTLANSNFENWINTYKDIRLDLFKLSIKNMSLDGALFDLDKLNNISKNYISLLNKEDLFNEIKHYAEKYDKKLLELINRDENYFLSIISIGRDVPNPRKDLETYSELYAKIVYFYNDIYDTMPKINLDYDTILVRKVCETFLSISFDLPEDLWVEAQKEAAIQLGFAKNKKMLKENNMQYMFSDYMNIIRTKICKSSISYDIYSVINLLSYEEVIRRLD